MPLKSVFRAGHRTAAAVWLRLRTLTALATARRSSRRALSRGGARRILVVCYGNIYRSAFVGELLRQRLPSAEVRSAGFHRVGGRPSPPRHVELCAKRGISLSQHRSVVITPEDASWADLILLMDRHNWAALNALGADVDKLVWLGSLLPGTLEIPDPYAMSDADAERVIARMYDVTERLVHRLGGRTS